MIYNLLILHRVGEYENSLFSDVSVNNFSLLLDTILKSGCKVSSIKSAHNALEDTIVLTFDDGWMSHYITVYPLLKKHNISATFFITTDFIGRKDYVTWEQLSEMIEGGMDIGSHSVTHPNFTKIDKIEAFKEAFDSKKILEERLGVKVNSFSFPGGYYDKKTVSLVKDCGYVTICNSNPGVNRHLKGGMVLRNSINAITKEHDFNSIIQPSKLLIYKKKMFHMSRIILRMVIGEKFYLKLRMLILK